MAVNFGSLEGFVQDVVQRTTNSGKDFLVLTVRHEAQRENDSGSFEFDVWFDNVKDSIQRLGVDDFVAVHYRLNRREYTDRSGAPKSFVSQTPMHVVLLQKHSQQPCLSTVPRQQTGHGQPRRSNEYGGSAPIPDDVPF